MIKGKEGKERRVRKTMRMYGCNRVGGIVINSNDSRFVKSIRPPNIDTYKMQL